MGPRSARCDLPAKAPWSRRYKCPLRLAGCFFLIAGATIFVGQGLDNNLIWVANGLLLAYLLLVPRWRWPRYLVAGFAAQMAASCALNPGRWRINLLLAALNLFEAIIGAWLVRRRTTELPRFTDRAYLLRFIGYAVLAAPLAAGIIFSLIYSFNRHSPQWPSLRDWVIADGLGTAIATPACVAIFQTRLKNAPELLKHWVYPALLIAVGIAAFAQTRAPMLFLLYPLLILVLLRFGLGWASLAALFVAASGSWFTLRGIGPFAMERSFGSTGPSILLQLHIASGMFMLYAVSVVLENLRSAKHKIRELAALQQLVLENSRDIIILADFDGNRSYVSPSAEKWGAWSSEQILSHKSLDLVHPEDRPRVAQAVRDLRSGQEGSLIECRVCSRDGRFVWVEASLRAIRDPVTGMPKGLLNMVRDISERKAAEHELHEAYRALETLAATDPLTRLANRRRFDQSLTTEWRRAARSRQPLSLLLLDVDLFKSYNDTYGHLRGDARLKQIAEAAQQVVTRAGDLVARFGGEEFAVVLPDTSNQGAIKVAEQICIAVRRLNVEHSANPLGYLTISVGCATVIPGMGHHPASLIQMADDALYAAKRNGRNQACNADAGQMDPAVLQAS
jgi:diguanylate cyclase (GGDEF)-like protein/PAS domain S-box-containing protein